MFAQRMWINIIIAATMMFSNMACQIERLFPDRVADGVARLTVANNTLLLLGIRQQINLPPECDLFSLRQSDNAVISGQAGEKGSVTKTYRDCVYDFGEGLDITSPVEGEAPVGRISGKVTLNGTQVMHGTLTGSEVLPVIPQGKDSLQFHIDSVRFDNFTSTLTSQNKTITFIDGQVGFLAAIHLAADERFHICEVPLPNVTFSNIEYKSDSGNPVRVIVPGPFGDFQAEIASSMFNAQLGVFESETNTLSGSLTVWDKTQKVPSDGKGLEPDFSEASYLQDLQKTTNLYFPVSYDCPFSDFIAATTARLLLQNAGILGKQIAVNNQCGFDATSVLKNPSCVEGKVGEPGLLEFQTSANKACHVASSSSPLSIDCQNVQTFTQGSADFNAVQVVRGERETYKPIGICPFGFLCYASIIPRSPDAVSIQLYDVDLHNYAAYTVKPNKNAPVAKLTIQQGHLSGIVEPILTESRTVPCRFDASTPVAKLSQVNLKDAQVTLEIRLEQFDELEPPLLRYAFDVEHSGLEGQNGIYQGKGNYLKGFIRINNVDFNIQKADGGPVILDPFFNQEDFDRSYSCRLTCNSPPDDPRQCYSPMAMLLEPDANWDPLANCNTVQPLPAPPPGTACAGIK